MDLELRHARVVVAVAAAGSVSRAAVALGLPQPSVTAKLRRIERALGGALFLRTPSGVRPTPLGDRVVPLLADLVGRAERVLAEVDGAAPRRLHLGRCDATSVAFSRSARAALPGRDVSTTTADQRVLLEELRTGELDAALLRDPPDRPPGEPVDRAVVLVEPQAVLVAAGSPLAARPVVALRELAGCAWVRRSAGSAHRAVEDAALRLAGDGPAVVHRSDDEAELREWVRGGGAVALVGAPRPTPGGWEDGVRAVPVDDPVRSTLVLVWRPSAVDPATAAALLALLRADLAAGRGATSRAGPAAPRP